MSTAIEWADETFNPWWGCTKVSPGCEHCYAEEIARRFHVVDWGAGVPRHRTSADNWRAPLRWHAEALGTGRTIRVFSGSMCDVFDAEVDPAWRAELWRLIRQTPALTWMLLTKRPNLIARSLPADWGAGYPHVWLGTSVESPEYLWRIAPLVQVPAVVHIISAEPLLAPVELPLAGIQWVIGGGESGPEHRPFDMAWARAIRDQCAAAAVTFFFKQVGGRYPTSGGCELDGVEHKAWPTPPPAPPTAPRQQEAQP